MTPRAPAPARRLTPTPTATPSARAPASPPLRSSGGRPPRGPPPTPMPWSACPIEPGDFSLVVSSTA